MSLVEVVGLTIRVPDREIVTNTSFSVEQGKLVALMGPSGSGKTSVLNCLSGIARPAAGTITIAGTTITNLNPRERAAFRLRQIGLVFQFGELLPELTVTENVALPLRLQGIGRAPAEATAHSMLARLGLGDRGTAHPEELSGGEVQRVAVARALVHQPPLVLADEPTGALDEDNALKLMDLLIQQSRDLGTTVIIATHDPLVAQRVERTLRIRQGAIIEAGARREPAAPLAGERA